MTKYLTAYVTVLTSFVLIDLLWLMWLARGFYVQEIGALLRNPPNIAAAIVFYFLYAAGLVLFAVMPGLKAHSALTAMIYGGALGLIAYATYDLTNLSVMNGFSVKMAVVDMAWGAALSAAASWIAAKTVLAAF